MTARPDLTKRPFRDSRAERLRYKHLASIELLQVDILQRVPERPVIEHEDPRIWSRNLVQVQADVVEHCFRILESHRLDLMLGDGEELARMTLGNRSEHFGAYFVPTVVQATRQSLPETVRVLGNDASSRPGPIEGNRYVGLSVGTSPDRKKLGRRKERNEWLRIREEKRIRIHVEATISFEQKGSNEIGALCDRTPPAATAVEVQVETPQWLRLDFEHSA